jgi:hypothetical protein
MKTGHAPAGSREGSEPVPRDSAGRPDLVGVLQRASGRWASHHAAFPGSGGSSSLRTSGRPHPLARCYGHGDDEPAVPAKGACGTAATRLPATATAG